MYTHIRVYTTHGHRVEWKGTIMHFKWIATVHKITESLKKLFGRNLSISFHLSSCLKQIQLGHSAQSLVLSYDYNLGFDYHQGWTIQNLTGQPVPVFDHTHSEKANFKSNLYFIPFNFCPLLPVLSLYICKGSGSILSYLPIRYLRIAFRCPFSVFCLRLRKPSSFTFFSLCPVLHLPVTLMTLCWTCSGMSLPFLRRKGSKTGLSSPCVVSKVSVEWNKYFPWSVHYHLPKYKSVFSWAFFMERDNTADSCSSYSSPGFAVAFLQSYFLLSWRPACTVAWGNS